MVKTHRYLRIRKSREIQKYFNSGPSVKNRIFRFFSEPSIFSLSDQSSQCCPYQIVPKYDVGQLSSHTKISRKCHIFTKILHLKNDRKVEKFFFCPKSTFFQTYFFCVKMAVFDTTYDLYSSTWVTIQNFRVSVSNMWPHVFRPQPTQIHCYTYISPTLCPRHLISFASLYSTFMLSYTMLTSISKGVWIARIWPPKLLPCQNFSLFCTSNLFFHFYFFFLIDNFPTLVGNFHKPNVLYPMVPISFFRHESWSLPMLTKFDFFFFAPFFSMSLYNFSS